MLGEKMTIQVYINKLEHNQSLIDRYVSIRDKNMEIDDYIFNDKIVKYLVKKREKIKMRLFKNKAKAFIDESRIIN